MINAAENKGEELRRQAQQTISILLGFDSTEGYFLVDKNNKSSPFPDDRKA